jgi:glucose-1-phosphate adenylyltransferase
MKNVLTVVLAGGAGERLQPLTRHRAKPAVPFGGMYRIIDFTLSNCVNSNCRRILVLVQYKSNSLARHIRSSWNIMHRSLGEFIDIVPPQMRVNSNWYLGTADAIYQNLYSIDLEQPSEVIILSGDHIYKMDYQRMVQAHREKEADVTVAALEVPVADATRFGVLQVDTALRLEGFEEKPLCPKPMPGRPDTALASMGIYVFNTEVLRRSVLEDAERSDSRHDFGRDILPRLLHEHSVYAYLFHDENKKQAKYWRDVGTLDGYWEANMDLVAIDPQFNLYDKSWPMRTSMPMLPPAKFVFADLNSRCGIAMDSVVSPGCILSGGAVHRCVLAPEVRINSYARVEESILYHGASIGRHCRIRRAIVEKDVVVPDNTIIGYDPVDDARRFVVSPAGVVVVEAERLPHVESHRVGVP